MDPRSCLTLDWIQDPGLLAVKLGQMHALRIDFLDPAKCLHLSQLYRKNAAVTQGKLPGSAATGCCLEGSERPFRPPGRSAPLATASIGQVHRGRLRDGSEVIVKVVKTDARDQFIRDVAAFEEHVYLVHPALPTLKRVGIPLRCWETSKPIR